MKCSEKKNDRQSKLEFYFLSFVRSEQSTLCYKKQPIIQLLWCTKDHVKCRSCTSLLFVHHEMRAHSIQYILKSFSFHFLSSTISCTFSKRFFASIFFFFRYFTRFGYFFLHCMCVILVYCLFAITLRLTAWHNRQNSQFP